MLHIIDEAYLSKGMAKPVRKLHYSVSYMCTPVFAHFTDTNFTVFYFKNIKFI